MEDNGLDGKLDLVVTLDFPSLSTCLYSDIVHLPLQFTKRRHEYLGYASVYSSAVCGR